MKKLIPALVLVAAFVLACAGGADAQTLTIDQKIKLTVAARTASGGPVTLADGTLVVWSVEGGAANGTFETGASPSLSVYFVPAKPGRQVVRASLTVEGITFTAQIDLTVTATVPDSIVIMAGVVVPR